MLKNKKYAVFCIVLLIICYDVFWAAPNIPVLMYHRTGFIENPINVRPDIIFDQLKILHDSGYTPLFFSDMKKIMTDEKKMPKKPVIITFDDGYFNNYFYVYPLLKQFNMKAVISVISGKMPQNKQLRKTCSDLSEKIEPEILENSDDHCENGYISSKEYCRMISDGVIEIADHTKDHFYFTQKKIDKNVFTQQVVLSKEKLQNDIKQNINVFTIPGGHYNAQLLDLLEKEKYSYILTCDKGIWDGKDNVVKRFAVFNRSGIRFKMLMFVLHKKWRLHVGLFLYKSIKYLSNDLLHDTFFENKENWK